MVNFDEFSRALSLEDERLSHMQNASSRGSVRDHNCLPHHTASPVRGDARLSLKPLHSAFPCKSDLLTTLGYADIHTAIIHLLFYINAGL